jgi:putative ABC transport system ATP-binding protein
MSTSGDAAPRSLSGYAWRVLGPRELLINLLINGLIAWWVYRHTSQVPVVGWLSVLVIVGPMSFIMPVLTTYFGYLNGVNARRWGRAGRPWTAGTFWQSKAWWEGLCAAAVAGPLSVIALLTIESIRPGLGFSRIGAMILVGGYGGLLSYFLHARAAIRAGRLGDQSPFAFRSESGSNTGERTVILDAQKVSKVYGAHGPRVDALRDVSLEIRAGELLAIVGPSGAGKSTLLHILGGLEFPSAGRVLVEGVDLSQLEDEARTIFRRQRIGFVFQRFNLLPNLTATQNVALPLMLDRVPSAERIGRARDMLNLVGMSQRESSYPSMLSGGEQQRVAIARALVTSPALILADEPTGMLDSGNSRQVSGLLRQLATERGQTVVMVTHDRDLARQADRQVQVLDGRVSEITAVVEEHERV